MNSPKPVKTGIGIIGAGAVGSALARAFAAAGLTVTVILDRRIESAQELAEEIGAARSGSDLGLLGEDTALLIVAVPDDQIAVVDRRLAKLPALHRIAVCAHTSGALPASQLAIIAGAGVAVASCHPLQTFPSRRTSPDLRGVYLALEGDAAAVKSLQELASSIGAIPVIIPSEAKAAYHAAAVFAANFLPALLRQAQELLAVAGIEPQRALAMLAPLARQSLENCVTQGPAQALTGPVARGDVDAIRRHLNALDREDPGAGAMYRVLMVKLIELSMEKGLNAEAALELAKIIAS